MRLRLWEHPGSSENLPSVLCIHGALDTGRSFDAVAAAVAGRAHVTAIDLRGHGQSERVGAGGSYHLLDFLKDLGLLVQQRRFDVVVGHSMGGNLALMLVGALPDCTGKLVLLDSVGPPPKTRASNLRASANCCWRCRQRSGIFLPSAASTKPSRGCRSGTRVSPTWAPAA